MPATPPPITSARRVTGTLIGSSGVVVPHLRHRHADQFDRFGRGLGAVVMHPGAVLADVGHLDAVRIQAGQLAAALRKVRRCMCGEQEATTTPSSCSEAIFSRTMRLARVRAHVLVVHRATHAGQFAPPASATSSTSTVRAMFSPHQQMKTPILAMLS